MQTRKIFVHLTERKRRSWALRWNFERHECTVDKRVTNNTIERILGGEAAIAKRNLDRAGAIGNTNASKLGGLVRTVRKWNNALEFFHGVS